LSELFQYHQPNQTTCIDNFDQLARTKIKSEKERISSKLFYSFGLQIPSPQNISTSQVCDIYFQKEKPIHSEIQQISHYFLGRSYPQITLFSQTEKIKEYIHNFESRIKFQKNKSTKSIPSNKGLFSRAQFLFHQQDQLQLQIKSISTIIDSQINLPNDFNAIQVLSSINSTLNNIQTGLSNIFSSLFAQVDHHLSINHQIKKIIHHIDNYSSQTLSQNCHIDHSQFD
jgi:hypothetical protein